MRPFLAALLLVIAFPILAFATAQKYEVAIDGMTCADCAKAVSMALDKIPNIEKSSVKVSLKAKNAVLTMNESDRQTEAQVKKAIEDAGYTVKSIHTLATNKN